MTYYLSDGMLNLTHSPKPKFHLARHVKFQHIRPVEPVKLVMSNVSSRAFRQALHSQNAWARHVTSQVQFGLYSSDRKNRPDILCSRMTPTTSITTPSMCTIIWTHTRHNLRCGLKSTLLQTSQLNTQAHARTILHHAVSHALMLLMQSPTYSLICG